MKQKQVSFLQGLFRVLSFQLTEISLFRPSEGVIGYSEGFSAPGPSRNRFVFPEYRMRVKVSTLSLLG